MPLAVRLLVPERATLKTGAANYKRRRVFHARSCVNVDDRFEAMIRRNVVSPPSDSIVSTEPDFRNLGFG